MMNKRKRKNVHVMFLYLMINFFQLILIYDCVTHTFVYSRVLQFYKTWSFACMCWILLHKLDQFSKNNGIPSLLVAWVLEPVQLQVLLSAGANCLSNKTSRWGNICTRTPLVWNIRVNWRAFNPRAHRAIAHREIKFLGTISTYAYTSSDWSSQDALLLNPSMSRQLWRVK